MYVPKVSVVVPVYNGANFLRHAVDSALAQSYPNIEVLVIDDGSTDGGATRAIARTYGDRVRLISKPNGGVGSALNVAIENMEGEFFSWLSHDDVYAPNKVAAQISELAGRRDVVLYSDYAVFTDDVARHSPVRLRGVRPEQFRYWLTLENALHGCTLLVPRAAFDRHGRFDESLRTTQDYDMWFRMASTYKFAHMSQVLVYGRSHAEQGSVKLASIASRECNELMKTFVDGLSPAELEAGSQTLPAAAYLRLYESFLRRGFHQAASHTRRRHLLPVANARGVRGYLVVLARTVSPLVVSFTRGLARRVTTQSFRRRLRDLAGQRAAQAAGR